jgi:hypothetical protein
MMLLQYRKKDAAAVASHSSDAAHSKMSSVLLVLWQINT